MNRNQVLEREFQQPNPHILVLVFFWRYKGNYHQKTRINTQTSADGSDFLLQVFSADQLHNQVFPNNRVNAGLN